MKLIKSLIAAAVALGAVSTPLAVAPIAYAEGENSPELISPNPNASDASSSSASWLQVSPVSARVVLKPGSELDYSIIVSNVGTESFNFSVYAAPYTIVDEDYNVSFSNETNRSQIVRWIKFIADDGSLVDTYKGSVEAGAKKAVSYRISVPEDVPSGGQYATIFAQTDTPESSSNTSGLKTVSRIGMVVYGRSEGETEDSAEIAEYNVPGFLFAGPVSVKSLVKNTGNTDFEARYKLTVKSITGNELYTAEDSHNILPDTARRENLSWENTQFMGIFQVTYRVEALDQVREETHLVIIMPVYMIIIFIALLTILIVWIIMMNRKRKERKSRLVV